MSTTNFENGTLIEAPWMNDVDQFVYGNLDTITYYVATTGSDSNAGTQAAPFATLQKAFDVITAIGFLNGTRKIKVAAGTYNTASNRTARLGPDNEDDTNPNTDTYQRDGIVSTNWITIEGPDVGYLPASNPWPTPTAIFDGGGAVISGLIFENRINILIKNIKMQNYAGSAAIRGDGTYLRTENVHGYNNTVDILNYRGLLEVRGGILDGATQAAIKSFFNNEHQIGNQNAGAVGQGPWIKNAVFGLHAQEGATGHSDFVTYENCTTGILATVNARVNYNGSEFKRCGVAVRAGQAWVQGTISDFHDGTADANTENIWLYEHGIAGPRDDYANGGLASNYAVGPTTLTGSTISTALLSKTLTRGLWAPTVGSIRKPQHIEFVAYGTQSGTAGTKQFKLRLGGTLLVSITNDASDTGNWVCRGNVTFTASNVQAAYISYDTHLSTQRVNCGTAAVDMKASNQSLQFEVQLSNAGDSVELLHAHFKTWG